MAPIDADEVQPGLVAFLDVEVLAADDRVVNMKDPRHGIRPGPFVCLSVDSDNSEWAQVTTEARRERLEIRRDWRLGGYPQWLGDPQYLQDGANVWRGPLEAFLAASHEELTDRTNRAWVTEDGLREVVREVVAQRRRRDRD